MKKLFERVSQGGRIQDRVTFALWKVGGMQSPLKVSRTTAPAARFGLYTGRQSKLKFR